MTAAQGWDHKVITVAETKFLKFKCGPQVTEAVPTALPLSTPLASLHREVRLRHSRHTAAVRGMSNVKAEVSVWGVVRRPS